MTGLEKQLAEQLLVAMIGTIKVSDVRSMKEYISEIAIELAKDFVTKVENDNCSTEQGEAK